MTMEQGVTYKFEERLPENGQVIEVQNPALRWIEAQFKAIGDQWSLLFDADDIAEQDEVLEVFPEWREEQLKIMTKEMVL